MPEHNKEYSCEVEYDGRKYRATLTYLDHQPDATTEWRGTGFYYSICKLEKDTPIWWTYVPYHGTVLSYEEKVV